MKVRALLLLGLLGLAACPVFDAAPYCDSTADCAPGYACDQAASRCVAVGVGQSCSGSAGCGRNETCGEDRRCHVGSCTFHGCASGTCQASEGAWACVVAEGGTEAGVDGSAGAGGQAGAAGGGGSGGSAAAAGVGGSP